MKWQDVFELVEVSKYQHGGFHTVGGDPELSARDPVVYKIRNKETGEWGFGGPSPKYTAEYYANKYFQEMVLEVERMLVGFTNE